MVPVNPTNRAERAEEKFLPGQEMTWGSVSRYPGKGLCCENASPELVNCARADCSLPVEPAVANRPLELPFLGVSAQNNQIPQ